VDLSGLKIVVDGGNGAASGYAPALLRALGAEVVELHCAPDGRNINAGCGAVHPEAMQEAVVAHGAAMGVAFDGDADRAIFASHTGRRVDGDHVLYLCGRDLQAQGGLAGDTVVATSMSNLGLELALRRHGIGLVRTAVGDKYVLEEMVRRGAVLGGEQSGHVIFHDTGTTGDGMMTMLRVLGAIRRRGAQLEELANEMPVMPQRLVNVRFGRKRPLEELDEVQAAIRACEEEFGEAGRVVVRFSGTEPLARVMVEGEDAGRVDFHVHAIADAIGAALRE
jgi:phosphoglucosamine mutase